MGKTKEQVMGDIVKQSIRNIICIDDDFVEPYEVTDSHHKESELSGRMYRALSTECECAVTMVSYNLKISLEYLEKKMKQKDLLIIDWELTQPLHPEHTIHVIDCALRNNIPYICIYTNEQNTEGIEDTLKAYYSGHSKEEVKQASESCEELGIFKDDFASITKQSFSSAQADVRPLKNKLKELGIEVDRNQFNYEKTDEWYKLYLDWYGYILPSEKEYVADKKSHVLEVDGKKFFFFSKNLNCVQDTVDMISPEHIISRIVENIVESPDSIKDGICLYYSNRFQEALTRRPNILGDISGHAFAYYAKSLLEEDGQDEFELFIKGLFKQELEQQLDIQNAVIPELLAKELITVASQITASLIINELIQLNAKININGTLSSMNHTLSFGDVFKYNAGTRNRYLLCVTAKCDCRRPEKINKNYIFISGEKCKSGKALENAEKEYFSFLHNRDKEFIAVEWKKKLNTIYIPDNNVAKGKGLIGNLMGKEFEMEFICSLKENYAQRMANMAYADSNRVGISLAHLPETSASED